MAIFSRRIVQRALDENRLFLSTEQMNNHVNKLNDPDNYNSIIAIEWEVIILNTLSKFGEIQHEKTFKGAKKPDIYFTTKEITYIADVTTISDVGYNNDNPTDYFNEQLIELLRKKEVPPKGLTVTFYSEQTEYTNNKIKIMLPPKSDIPKLIKEELSVFLDSIKDNPLSPIFKKIERDNTFITIAFDPKNPYYSFQHQTYNIPQSLEKNPLFYRLKDKTKQLKQTEYEGITGVIICDGDCAFLNKQSYNNQKYSQENIVNKFLKNNSSLSFVLIITPEEDFQHLTMKRTNSIKTNLYTNSVAKFPVSQQLIEILNQFTKNIPQPESMPTNAISHMKSDPHRGISHYGGFSLYGDDVIKIPSRMFTKLLSGNLNFDQLYGNDTSQNSSKNTLNNFFLRQLNQGAMIESITVEKCIDQDDDWLRIKYSSTSDAAISKYK